MFNTTFPEEQISRIALKLLTILLTYRPREIATMDANLDKINCKYFIADINTISKESSLRNYYEFTCCLFPILNTDDWHHAEIWYRDINLWKKGAVDSVSWHS